MVAAAAALWMKGESDWDVCGCGGCGVAMCVRTTIVEKVEEQGEYRREVVADAYVEATVVPDSVCM